MSSEIRVNQIQNRSGLTTTTLTDTGVTIAGILTVSENLNVGGVLTYEDVTNIDSVGVITARNGIRIGATGANTLITGNGTGIGIGITTPTEELHIRAATPVIRLEDGDNARQSQIVGSDGNFRFDADNNNAIANTNIAFRTDGVERLRIDSNGNLNLGLTASPVSSSSEQGVFLAGANSTQSAISSDVTPFVVNRVGTGGNDRNCIEFRNNGALRGTIGAIGAADGIFFQSGTTEVVRITSGGTLNIGGSTQTTHLLYLQSTGDASIHLAADTDNVTEDHNPSISMSQDGGGSSQMFKIGMEAGNGAEFSQSIGNGCYIHANNHSSQPLQLAHMDNLAVTISSVHGSHFHTYGGNTVAGVKIANRGNDTAAALLLQGHNNTGVPGQATNTQLTHKGANLTFNINHNGTDRLVIGSTGVVSGNLNNTSDIALKKDIESISTSCIDNIKQLNPVTFKWKDTSKKDIGFIAQEVEVILPDLVNGEDGVKSINTIGLVSQLTKALQEAITEIETLKTKVVALEGS